MKYMIIVAKQGDYDLTIIDFDLSKEEAEKRVNLLNADEYETICICEHGKFNYL